MAKRELDLVLAAFRAISRPEELAPQLDAAEQPLKRLRWVIWNFCSKLGETTDYAQAVAMAMNREGKLGKRGVFELEELNEAELKKLIVALRKQTKRVSESGSRAKPAGAS